MLRWILKLIRIARTGVFRPGWPIRSARKTEPCKTDLLHILLSWAAGSVTGMILFSMELVTYWWSRRSQFFLILRSFSLVWWDASGKILKTQEMKLASELLSLCWRNFKRLFDLWFAVCSFSYRGNQPRRCKSCGTLHLVGWFNRYQTFGGA